ncbi:hypothetical protein STCU_06196 [Strigomonas culicis]|uniref:Uncharacterized protein n=1 Tax=Strigomonas culicis TaxID=28005 RepID=S9UCA8_9TRYP|nr:hypothetical protein STCU_06196 [Strigomonas culicis]|eukprot:EPY26553.1 hypothetical protein STCU_06196 [Strigomonas culicis]
MLQCIASLTLPGFPQQTQVLRHALKGVAVAAVSYAPTPAPSARPSFTIVEVRLPYDPRASPQLTHVPLPGGAVTALTLVRSSDGEDLYVLAQCQRAPDADEEGGGATATYLYKRTEGEAPQDVFDDDAIETNAQRHAYIPYGDDACVYYKRLPRPVEDDGLRWSCVAPVTTLETSVGGGAAALVVAAGGGGLTDRPTSLQLLQVQGTRAAPLCTVELGSLAHFVVEGVLPLPGTSDCVLLRCHHCVVAVDLAAVLRRAKAGDAAAAPLQQVWQWTPHDRLTAACVLDRYLFATTEDGAVVQWALDGALVASSRALAGAGLRGLHAAHLTELFTAAADGLYQWDYQDLRAEMAAGVPGTSALADYPAATVRAATTTNPFAYVPQRLSEAALGEELLAMGGDGGVVAVVGEYGTLQLFVSA